MIGLEQSKVPHVANEYCSPATHALNCFLQCPDEVLGAREVLNDRIDHDYIEVLRGNAGQIVCLPVQERDLAGVLTAADGFPEAVDRNTRQVESDVLLAVGNQSKSEQTCAAADFQNTARTMCQYAVDRSVHIVEHLFLRQRQTRVRVVPSRQC